MDLRTICQTALREISGITVPSTFAGNTNLTAVLALALANRAGRTLSLDYRWQALIRTHTFDTADGTTDYDLPDDYHSFANLTFWDRTNIQSCKGPVSPMLWEALRSGNLVGAGFKKYFRVAADQFSIFPTPDAADTIAYQYYTNEWITGKTEFDDDADEPLIDSDLIILDLKWRFRKAKGLEWKDEEREAIQRRDALLAKDGGKDILDFSAPAPPPVGNIAESGFGA